MLLKKQVIANSPAPYSVNTFHLKEKMFIGVGSEGPHPSFLIDLSNNNIVKVSDGPGGTMCLSPALINDTDLISVMGMFPPFVGMDAGVYVHSLKSGVWCTRKILTLPFAHRCEILNKMGTYYLFLSSVSKEKSHPDDWSNPGELYVIPVNMLSPLENFGKPLLNNVTRNHGMIKTHIGGNESVCISGSEGIIAVLPDNKAAWRTEILFDKEVSEFEFYDIDNDCKNELITIEPFHGNSLNIYKRSGNSWIHSYQAELSFGHGLSVGQFNEVPSIAVGSRGGDKSLLLFSVYDLKQNQIAKHVIEENAGPTQTRIFRHNSIDHILSSNQSKNEIALYTI